MTTYALTIEESPRTTDQEALIRGLNEHAAHHTPRPGFKPLGAFMRDERGALIGGAYGYVNWNWLFINLVWVSESARGGGHEKLGYEVFSTLDDYPPGHGRFFMKKALGPPAG